MNTPLLLGLLHTLLWLLTPIALVGLINRCKAWWQGKRGPRLSQSWFDLRRLLGKQQVLSHNASPLFRVAPYVVLGGVLGVGAWVPLLGGWAPLAFSHDFVVMAYVLGLGRILMMLAALDTGSPFEGMGAAREAYFGAWAEPTLFLTAGSLALASGHTSLTGLITTLHSSPDLAVLALPVVAVLLILLQTEAARVPVDDPNTHLELTMIHEVMILDHSGPALAALQLSAAFKMTLYAGLIASLLNPFNPLQQPLAALGATLVVLSTLALTLGSIESLCARLPMRWVGRYVLLAWLLAAGVLTTVGVLRGGL